MRAIYLLLITTLFIPFGCCAESKDSSVLKEHLESILSKTAYKNYSGVVFVAKGEQVIFNVGVGASDTERDIPFSSRTVLDIGSITKQFTAAAILKLETQNKLSTTDKASKYIDSLKGDLSTITIHELLTHTSGITSVTGDDYQRITKEDLINHLNSAQLEFKRGSHNYSNLGYSLLGLIVEKVSEKPLDVFLGTEFFDKIGIQKTGYTFPKFGTQEVSRGYLNGQDWGLPHKKVWGETGPYWNLRGNGGMLSTAEDMFKWHRALLTDQYLSQVEKNKLFAMHVKEYENSESYYGYGWVVELLGSGKKMIWHNGGNGIFSADVRYYPSSDIYYFLAGNRSDSEIYQMSDEIHRLVSSF